MNIDINDSEILALFTGLERKIDFEKWPDYVFFFRGGKRLFRYDLNDGWLWCDRDEVWDKISAAKGFEYAKTQQFIKKLVEKHFKLRGVAPKIDFEKWPDRVGQHFKMRGVAPLTPGK